MAGQHALPVERACRLRSDAWTDFWNPTASMRTSDRHSGAGSSNVTARQQKAPGSTSFPRPAHATKEVLTGLTAARKRHSRPEISALLRLNRFSNEPCAWCASFVQALARRSSRTGDPLMRVSRWCRHRPGPRVRRPAPGPPGRACGGCFRCPCGRGRGCTGKPALSLI